ncbi:MAG: hypothetical protein ACI4JC_05760 [Faecalibacterium sp.]
MNINKINQRWPISCRDSLAAIDHMSVSDALEIGLITKEESEFICDDFVMRATIAMETKGYATSTFFLFFKVVSLNLVIV